jgi:hypothetical protein
MGKEPGDCWQPFLMQNEICARRFYLAVSLQRTGTGGPYPSVSFPASVLIASSTLWKM